MQFQKKLGTEKACQKHLFRLLWPGDFAVPAAKIEMDDTYFGAPKPGKRGRGAAGKAKVVVAVETPADKLRFAAMRMVPRVSREEIQPLIGQRLAAAFGSRKCLTGCFMLVSTQLPLLFLS